jgi:anaerobic selenocysteine-containing dehydrogenase
VGHGSHTPSPNVQGIGSVGVTPKLKKAIFENLTDTFHLKLPTSKGLDTMACMEKAADGNLSVGICLGGNLYGSNPDSLFASKALSKLDLLVTLSTTLNTGHAWALAKDTIVLPVLPRDEEPQATTQESMFNYVRMSDGGEPRVDGPRSEVSVIAELGMKVQNLNTASPLQGLNWAELNDTKGIRSMISRVVPGWKAIGSMDESKEEFQIEGRSFHEPTFPTDDGRARLHSARLPDVDLNDKAALRLMTIRSEGQFNTVVYEDFDAYRGAAGRDVVLIHPEDLIRLGFSTGERITVHGPAGRMPYVQLMSFDRIKPGNVAMYFPEANVLLGRDLDPLSRTPAFKGALVTLHD